MERYYQPEVECASRETILALQNERLVKQVRHVWDHVPYYRKKMEEKASRPTTFKAWPTSTSCRFSARTICGKPTPTAF